MKFSASILFFFQASMLAMSEKTVFAGKRGNHSETMVRRPCPEKKKKIRPKFQDIFYKTVQPSGENSEEAPYLYHQFSRQKHPN